MTVIRKCKAGDLERLLRRDLARLDTRIDRAIKQTAADGVAVVRENAPIAFGELRDGIEATDTSILSTAPHAADVEIGSRPHMPNYESILAWVRLRGMQGLDIGTGGAPEWVADRIRERGDGASTPVDAAEQVAWAVCKKIAREGTRPRWYMRDSVPDVFSILDTNLHNFVFRDE